MQILTTCESERKHRSVQNEQPCDLSPLLSRSNTLHEGELRLKLKQKMRRDLSALSAELIQLSPSSDQDALNEPENDRHTLNKLQVHHQQPSLPKQFPDRQKAWGKSTFAQQPYTLNIPVQLIFEEQAQEEDFLNNTGEIMDNKFDRILELNCSGHGMDILEIQSQFTVVKSYRHLNDPEIYEPDVRADEVPAHNIHEKLLEEENHYLREQLIGFTQVIDSNKQCLQQLNHKYRRIKKENSKIKQQFNQMQEAIKVLGDDLSKKDAIISHLNHAIEENSRHLNQVLRQRQFNEVQIERLEKNCLDFEERLQNYALKRESEIEVIEEQKLKLKQYYEDLLAEKQKDIAELNDFIIQLRSKDKKVQSQTYRKKTQDNVMQTSRSSEEQESSRIFQNGTNSICLSLAEAQSLKNIIEEKQEQHKAQLQLIKQGFIERQKEIYRSTEQIQFKLAQLERMNLSLSLQNEAKQRKLEHLEQILSNSETNDDLNEEWGGPQELLRMGYSRRVKKLEKHVLQTRQEKMQLLAKINELQQRFLNGQKQQDDELEQLLENCVNQLEKEREISYILRTENDYFKQLLCKQQMIATMPIFN